MKLTLTIKDVKAAVFAKYNMPEDSMLEILEKEPEPPMDVMVDAAIRAVEQFDYMHSQKIAAIKAYRTVVPSSGLAEAKWIIENWSTWKGCALKKGALPHLVNREPGYIIGVD